MKNKQELGKMVTFSIFLFGSLILILSIWTTSMIGGEDTGVPGYVRATMAIPTSEGFELTLEALPTSDRGQGGGGGQGNHDEHEDVTPTITPTFNVDDWVQEEDISDDLADE